MNFVWSKIIRIYFNDNFFGLLSIPISFNPLFFQIIGLPTRVKHSLTKSLTEYALDVEIIKIFQESYGLKYSTLLQHNL